MVTDNLSDLLKILYDTRTQKNALDKVEKAILADLKPLVDPMLDKVAESEGSRSTELGVLPSSPVINAGGITLTRIVGTSRSIQADLLLERGVSPDVVSYATKTTSYFSYRVKEAN